MTFTVVEWDKCAAWWRGALKMAIAEYRLWQRSPRVDRTRCRRQYVRYCIAKVRQFEEAAQHDRKDGTA